MNDNQKKLELLAQVEQQLHAVKVLAWNASQMRKPGLQALLDEQDELWAKKRQLERELAEEQA